MDRPWSAHGSRRRLHIERILPWSKPGVAGEMASKVQALSRRCSVEVGCKQVLGFCEDTLLSGTAHSPGFGTGGRKRETIALDSLGLVLSRQTDDTLEVPIDYRYLDLLFRASEDPEVGLASFAGRC